MVCAILQLSVLSKLYIFEWNRNGESRSTESLVSVSRRWKEGAWDWNARAVWSFAHPAILTLWLLPVTRCWSPNPFSPLPSHYFVYVVGVVIAFPRPPSLPMLLSDGSSQFVAAGFRLSRTWHSLTDCFLASHKPDITCSVRHPCEARVCAPYCAYY